MDFDKSRVYTAKDADEVKVGSKVIVAENMARLKNAVSMNLVNLLLEVRDDYCTNRFAIDSDSYFPLCYLVSEPEEKKLKWTDLKVKDVIKRGKETAEVTYINEEGIGDNDLCHICVGCRGLIDDKELEEWEKVEE